MSGGTVTPPRTGDRADEELVAPVVALRRRTADEAGIAGRTGPVTSAFTLFDKPGAPAPTLSDRDMWDDRANQLHGPEPAPTLADPREQAQRPAHPRPPAARRALAVTGVLAALAAVTLIASPGGHHAGTTDRPAATGKGVSAAHATGATPSVALVAASRTRAATGARARRARESSARLNRTRELARAKTGASSRPTARATATVGSVGAASTSPPQAPDALPSATGASGTRPVSYVSSVTDPNRCVPGDLAC
jgi:hypothetical protein